MNNKNNKYNQKHLTLSNRTFIEQELCQGSSFKSIELALHKDPTTIAKEVKLHLSSCGATDIGRCRSCLNYPTCDVRGKDIGVDCNKKYCTNLCRRCWNRKPPEFCSYYLPRFCKKPSKAPYVCNSCVDYKFCCLEKSLYNAVSAQKEYEKTLVKCLSLF